MTTQPLFPRSSRPTRPAASPASPAQPPRALRRVVPPADPLDQPEPAPPPEAEDSEANPGVQVILQVPNFALRRAPATAFAPPASAAIPEPIASAVQRPAVQPPAAKPVANSTPARLPTSRDLLQAARSAPSNTSSSRGAPTASPAPQPTTAAVEPVQPPVAPPSAPVSPSPPAAATPTVDDKVTLSQRLRWLDNLPEWQRLGLQAVVMIAAAILVVAVFAWWRRSDGPGEPLPRRNPRTRLTEDELFQANSEPVRPRASVARKLGPRVASPTNDSSGSDERPPATLNTPEPSAPAESPAEPVSPPLNPEPAMPEPTSAAPTSAAPANVGVPRSGPAPTSMTSPGTTAAVGTPASPVETSPTSAAYPTTDPQRYRYRETAQDPSSEAPAAETARLGEIAPLRTGSIR
ncbi:MAG: hypothetical protein U0935_14770 [Pirellulales bacterium]